MTQPTIIFRSVTTMSAFAAGLALGCRSQITNAGHCYYAGGDQTCAERFGDQRPFCMGPGEGCSGAHANDGCVAELPPAQCYSPCGNSSLVDEDQSCLGIADDTETDTEDESGDAEAEGDGDGDGDEPEPICGDGTVDPDEECDDGNTVDDDDRTNACTIAVCGDGIVQAALGETCDDGNTEGGDGCTANCILAGTIIWSRYSDLPNATGRSVTVTHNNNIVVVANSTGLGIRVIGMDPDGNPMWNVPGPPQATHIAADDNGRLVVGGVVDGKGQVWRYYADGSSWWTKEIPAAPTSTVKAVATYGNGNSSTIAVGSAYGAGALLRHNAGGTQLAFLSVMGTPAVDGVAGGADGTVWLLRQSPRQVERRNASDDLVWISPQITAVGDIYARLATDSSGTSFVVGNVPTALEAFGVVCLDERGATAWTTLHDDEDMFEAAFGIATPPTGGVVVAGYTSSDIQGTDANALVSWFDSDGTLMGDFVYDGDKENDKDWFADIAVGPDGNLVAVGWHQPSGGNFQLWTVKIAF